MRFFAIILFAFIGHGLAFDWQLTYSSCNKISYTLSLIIEEVQQASTIKISFQNGPTTKISFPIRNFFSSSKLTDTLTTVFDPPLAQSYPNAQAIVGVYDTSDNLIIYPEGTASDTEAFSAPISCSGSMTTSPQFFSSSSSSLIPTTTITATTTTPLSSSPASGGTTTLPASSPAAPIPTSSDVYTGACSCTVNKCEHTLNVDGCDGQLSYGQSTAAFCSVGPTGNQQIFETYSNFVYNQNPTDGCQVSSSITDYCSCTAYQGSDFGNLTLQSFPKNTQGYPTSTDYYNGVGQAGNACYCDFQAYANSNAYGDISDATLLGYFSLGTNSQPVYCTTDGVYAQKGDSQVIAGCSYVNPSTYDTLCHCSPSSAAVTGQYPNLTVAQTSPSPNQSLINLVAAQMRAKNGGGDGNSDGDNTDNMTDGVVIQKITNRAMLTSMLLSVCTVIVILV